ncbi:MAG: GlsB/YeaQ/YmgE family stress response membrane protein [Bdellovibrionales bacterium]|nr:GlsB/YeaQ/YmgE family stress response membrane protein [Bdellovibrionales bacterium]
MVQKFLAIPYVPLAVNWVGLGLASGVVAKVLLPGDEKLGWIRTILLGILGAFLGGVLAAQVGLNVRVGWNVYGFAAAVAGSLVLLLVNRVVTRS